MVPHLITDPFKIKLIPVGTACASEKSPSKLGSLLLFYLFIFSLISSAA